MNNSGIHNPFFGKHHSEISKQKMRLAHLNRPPISLETRIKMSDARKGSKNPNWKGEKIKPQAGRRRAQKLYPCPKGIQRHHIDGNPLNNVPENIQFATPKQHTKIDGRANRLSESGIATRFKKGNEIGLATRLKKGHKLFLYRQRDSKGRFI